MKRESHIDIYRVASFLQLTLPPLSFVLWILVIFLPAIDGAFHFYS